jgi:hypothetical protein
MITPQHKTLLADSTFRIKRKTEKKEKTKNMKYATIFTSQKMHEYITSLRTCLGVAITRRLTRLCCHLVTRGLNAVISVSAHDIKFTYRTRTVAAAVDAVISIYVFTAGKFDLATYGLLLMLLRAEVFTQ